MHAATALGWYGRRWTIETWFRTLKTGARIKDRRLHTADDLRKCLTFDAVTAVIDLGRLVGAHPSTCQPLPGTRNVWQGLEGFNWAIQVRDAIGERKRE